MVRQGSSLGLAFLISITLLVDVVAALPIRVVPNRYVVQFESELTAKVGGVGVLSREMRAVGLDVLKSRKNFAIIKDNYSQDPCAELMKAQIVKFCEPDYIVQASVTSNDPQYSQQWGLNQSTDVDIDAPQAWEITHGTSSSDVVVAVIDTGIAYNHPDLAANIWNNPNEIPNNGIDDDGNGYIDDIHGVNTISGFGNPLDDNGHGTHVSGIIGAVGNNSLGVVGVNWNVKILGAKFLDSDGSGSLSDGIEAIDYIIDLKNTGVNVRVINASWGSGANSQNLRAAIARARDAGILFVAAAGNDGENTDTYPNYPSGFDLANVVSVAAVDAFGSLAYFSNFGFNSVDIAAPGDGILSTYLGNSYATLSGTSMATPYVAGAVALLLQNEPGLSYQDLKSRLILSGRDLPGLDGLVASGRMLNLDRLLRNQNQAVPVYDSSSSYDLQRIGYFPNAEVSSTPVVLEGDEAVYYKVDLSNKPFTFFGTSYANLWVSLNGRIVFSNPGSSLDYQNTAVPSAHSIDILHSDLVGGQPDGVRVLQDESHLYIQWRMRAYGYGSSRVTAQAELDLDTGEILSFYDFSKRNLISHLGRRSTIGLTGRLNQTVLYSYNNASTLSQHLGLRYIPVSNSAGQKLSVRVEGKVGRANFRAGRVYSKSRLKLSLKSVAGTQSNQAFLNLSLNSRYQCKPMLLPLRDGEYNREFRAPALASSVTAVTFKARLGSLASSGSVKARVVKSSRSVQRLQSNLKISSAVVSRTCRDLQRKLR